MDSGSSPGWHRWNRIGFWIVFVVLESGQVGQEVETYEFSALLYVVGANCCVNVPESVSASLDSQGEVPVVVVVGGARIRTMLTPRGRGRHMLVVDRVMRRSAGVDTGDMVDVILWADIEPREMPIPADVVAAFSKVRGGKEAFLALTAAERLSFLQWVQDETSIRLRKRRIKKGVATVLAMTKGRLG